MEYATPLLLLAVLIAVGLLLAKAGRGATPGADPANAALLAETRRQLDAANAAAERERAAKTEALTRAAAAEAAGRSAQEHLAAAQDAHAAALSQLRGDHAKAQEEATQRYARDLAELKTSFAKMSTDVLKGMAPDVTKEVSTKVEPLIAQINSALASYRQTMQQSLASQGDALTQVREQMAKITETTAALATSTNDFTSVLKSSQHRGRWGEQTLRRVVEASGLSPHCDFIEQTAQGDTRPDLIVLLPGDRCVIIDSKVPEFDVALVNQAAPNRKELVEAHAAKLRATIKQLADKDYPGAQAAAGRVAFDKVILFLPAESLLSTALEGDGDLIVDAGRQGILLATPATLMGFLSAINLTWLQHKQAQESKDVIEKATNLYKSVADFAENMAGARDGLESAVRKFNTGMGSYRKFVLPKGQDLLEIHGLQPSKLLPGEKDAQDLPTEIRRLDGTSG
ncbi:DNA recombination protein RmuC [bacterium]|jgi:DNA recombination protein RmuC|nr:DNA recombination protein RmuC [bacterium]